MRDDCSLLMIAPGEDMPLSIYECTDQQGMITELTFIPPEQRGREIVTLYPIESYVADLMMHPDRFTPPNIDVYRKDGVTHLALIALPVDSVAKMMFDGVPFGVGFLVYWCAAHNKYRLVHCNSCANCLWAWFCDMQEEWNAVGGGVQKEGPTYH